MRARGAALGTGRRDTLSEVEHYAELATHYRAQGGVTYKLGLLQWAEAQQRKAEAQQESQVKQQQQYEPAPVPAAPSTDAPNSGP